MNEYSDDQAEVNQEVIEKWWDEFVDTRYFVTLPENHKDHANFIISAFTDYMYSYEGETHKEWDCSALVSCALKFSRARSLQKMNALK